MCRRPPCRLLCGPVEWRWGVCVLSPVFGLGPPLHIVLVSLVLSCPSCIASPFLSSSLPLSTVRVLCHSIVGLVLCFCDRVVSLWNSGDGLCGVEGRVVFTVRCRLFMCCGVCFSVVCVVLLCCVVEWRGVVGGCEGVRVCGLVVCLSLSVFPSSLLLVFGVVRAQLCEHARYPRTPSYPLIVLSSLVSPIPRLSFAPRLSSRLAFLLLEWRWVIHHVSECCVGMTATGSLSRSSSFFW